MTAGELTTFELAQFKQYFYTGQLKQPALYPAGGGLYWEVCTYMQAPGNG
jgi:hypothetical protein